MIRVVHAEEKGIHEDKGRVTSDVLREGELLEKIARYSVCKVYG